MLVAVIRRLEEVSPHEHNDLVITEFRHRRLAYSMRHGAIQDVQLDVVLREEILQRIPIVPDMHVLSLRHGFDVDVSRLPDNCLERHEARFFVLQGLQLTSIRPSVS